MAKIGAFDLHNNPGIMRNQEVTHFSDTGVDPWKGVGAAIDPKVTTGAEALVQAGLDFKVQKVPVYANYKTGPEHHGPHNMVLVPDANAIVRADTGAPLGIVGSRYQPIQNDVAVSVLDPIVQSGRAVYEVAGVLYEGRKVWVMIRFTDEIVLPGNDRVVRYLLYMNSHDGTTAMRVFPTPKRAACANVLAMYAAKFGADGLSVRHTTSAEARIQEAGRILTASDSFYKVFTEQAHAMAGRKITDAEFKGMLETLLPTNEEEPSQRTLNMREKIQELFEYGADHQAIAGTAWAALNAVAEFADHHRSTRVVGGRDEGESRLNSTFFGTGHALKLKAYRYVSEEYMNFGV